MYRILIRLLSFFLYIIKVIFKSKDDLVLENLALRQQLSAYHTKGKKPKLFNIDRLFWIALKQVWTKWQDHLVIVKPETVIDWQRKRFRKHWTRISSQNRRPGRKRIKREIRDLIYQMAEENGIAERWILSARSDVLNHVIVFNEDHLRWLLKEYVAYYNKDRCHLPLDRDSPSGRAVVKKPSETVDVISMSKLGGLQHRYEWQEAA